MVDGERSSKMYSGCLYNILRTAQEHLSPEFGLHVVETGCTRQISVTKPKKVTSHPQQLPGSEKSPIGLNNISQVKVVGESTMAAASKENFARMQIPYGDISKRCGSIGLTPAVALNTL